MGSAPAIDVLVLTAADGEDVALRVVEERAVGAWEEFSLDGLPGRYGVRAFEVAGGRQLRVAHAHAQRMGETNAAAVAVAFVRALQPEILAMCGVCAGRPKFDPSARNANSREMGCRDAGGSSVVSARTRSHLDVRSFGRVPRARQTWRRRCRGQPTDSRRARDRVVKIVTFYSYKGGVGRTLALAWVARDLAARGKIVVAMDLDLEAPGLHYKLRPESGANPQAGFVDLAARFVRGDAPPASLMDYLLQVQSGLWLMPAGNAPSAVYWRELASVPWTSFLTESDLGIRFMHEIKARLREELKPDFLLIDARTGITELGSAAVALLSDAVVCLTTSAPESKEGLRLVMRSIAATARADGRPVPAWIPVLSRVPPEVPPDAVANSLALIRDYVQEPTDDLAATVAVDGVLVLTADHEVQLSEATALLVGRDARLTEDYRRLAQAVELGLANVAASPRTPLGRRYITTSHEAVELLRSDVEDYRRRAASGQEGDVVVLLRGLRQLERALGDAGQLDGALAASQELVARCRQLASTRPEAFLPELWRSLNNLGALLSELGQREAALAATQEAVALCIQLTEARPAVFQERLRSGLRNLAARLGDVQQPVETNATVREAVQLLARLRTLSRDKPSA